MRRRGVGVGAVKRKVKDKEVRHNKYTRARFGLAMGGMFCVCARTIFQVSSSL